MSEVSIECKLAPNLGQHLNFYSYTYPPYRQFIIAPIGSWNYNCANEKSDTDTKAIIVPSMDDIVLNKCDSFTHLFPNEEHFDATDIRNFLKSLQKGNPQFMEILFSNWIYPNEEFYGEEIHELLDRREDIARCNQNNTMRAFLGMADRNYNLAKARCEEDHLSKWVYQLVRIEECMRKYRMGYSFWQCINTTNRDTLLMIKDGSQYKKEHLIDLAKRTIVICEQHYEIFEYEKAEEDKWTQRMLYEIVSNVCRESIKGVK